MSLGNLSQVPWLRPHSNMGQVGSISTAHVLGPRKTSTEAPIRQKDLLAQTLKTGGSSVKEGAGEFKQPSGRWPANFILGHKPDCRKVGTSAVPGYTINRWDDGAKSFGEGAGHPFTSEVQPDIVENVYECVADCPCVLLDEQSGVTTSGAMRREVDGYPGESTTGFVRGRSVPGNQHGGSGGASRFFKQVGGVPSRVAGD